MRHQKKKKNNEKVPSYKKCSSHIDLQAMIMRQPVIPAFLSQVPRPASHTLPQPETTMMKVQIHIYIYNILHIMSTMQEYHERS